MREDFLKALGLDPGLQYPPVEVKKAWKKKCSEHHPDLGGDPTEFVKVTHAYKMLTDPSYRHKEERRVSPETPDINIRMTIPVTFEEAFFGREINVCFNRVELGNDFKPIIKDEQELLNVHFTLPRGCFDGHQVKEAGLGLKHGDVTGDLIINVAPMRHPRFIPVGADIQTLEKITLDVMLKGGEVEVQTMYGLRTLKVPHGTQPGAKLKIKRCGVGKFGDHIVVVDPVFPTKDGLKTEAWKGLDINWESQEETEDIKLEEMFIAHTGMHDLSDLFRRK